MTPDLMYTHLMRYGQPVDPHAYHRHEALALARARRRRWFGARLH